MTDLWSSDAPADWRRALDRYPDVVAAQGVEKLVELDGWYRDPLPEAIRQRRRAHVTHPELVRITEWKMARGVWRARNLVLVRGNDADAVAATSAEALAKAPHPTGPISALATLDGVGPATASAVAAAAAPDIYPFFDELVAARIPGLGAVAWTLGYYARYAEALRARAARLGEGWTPVMVERALWSSVGGKAGSA
jgi:hypothetical protein